MTTKQFRRAWKKSAASDREPLRRWARKAAISGNAELALAAQAWLARKAVRLP